MAPSYATRSVFKVGTCVAGEVKTIPNRLGFETYERFLIAENKIVENVICRDCGPKGCCQVCREKLHQKCGLGPALPNPISSSDKARHARYHPRCHCSPMTDREPYHSGRACMHKILEPLLEMRLIDVHSPLPG